MDYYDEMETKVMEALDFIHESGFISIEQYENAMASYSNIGLDEDKRFENHLLDVLVLGGNVVREHANICLEVYKNNQPSESFWVIWIVVVITLLVALHLTQPYWCSVLHIPFVC